MSKVNFEHFVQELARNLEIQTPNFQSLPIHLVKEFDSLGKITASLTIEQLFGFQIEYEVLDSVETIYALYEYCLKYPVKD